MTQINDELRMIKYYYANGVAIYLQNRSTDVETIKIWVPYPDRYKVWEEVDAEQQSESLEFDRGRGKI